MEKKGELSQAPDRASALCSPAGLLDRTPGRRHRGLPPLQLLAVPLSQEPVGALGCAEGPGAGHRLGGARGAEAPVCGAALPAELAAWQQSLSTRALQRRRPHGASSPSWKGPPRFSYPLALRWSPVQSSYFQAKDWPARARARRKGAAVGSRSQEPGRSPPLRL